MDRLTDRPLFVTEIFEIHVGRWGELNEEQYLVINTTTGVCEFADTRWVYVKSYAVQMTDEILKQNLNIESPEVRAQ